MSDGLLRQFDLCIFDADDTLRSTTIPGQPCPRGPGEWLLLPGVRDTMRRVPWMNPGGPRLGIASNQDQVAYGHLSEETARRLLEALALAAAGVILPPPAIQLCPHPADLGCACHKPAPGLLLRIMAYYGVPGERTLFVGNAESDRQAAAAAGAYYADSTLVFRRTG